MLADKRLSRLFFVLEKDQRLLLPIGLEKLGVDNDPMLLEMGNNVFLCYVLGKSRNVDHLGRGAAVAIVLGRVAVESVKVRVGVIVCVWGWCYVGVL